MSWWNAKDPARRFPPRTGKHNSAAHTAAIVAANSGQHSPERIEINRQAHIGQKSPLKGKTVVEIFGEEKAPAMLARSQNAAKIRGEQQKGKTYPEMYGEEKATEILTRRGLTKRATHELTKDPDTTDDYRYWEWKLAVKERDDYTCQHCGRKEEKGLHAHHKIQWDLSIKLRYEVSNGITLCNNCHRKEHHRMRRQTLQELISLLENINNQEINNAVYAVKNAFCTTLGIKQTGV